MRNNIIFEDAAEVLKKVDFEFLEGKTVLVTGATGLLGTHFLATLALLKERGMKITVIGSYHSSPAKHTFEIAERAGLGFHLEQDSYPFADVMIHAAGYAQPNIFTAKPIETIRLNTTYTQSLLERLLPGGKFLFVSSSEVYNGLGGLVTESSIGNTTPSHTRACYIEGKRCGETIINAHRKAGIHATSARLSLSYGPGTRKHDKRAMSVFIQDALTTDEIRLKFSGREQRTFCYISDAIEMMWNVCLRGTQPVYNVGGNKVTNMAAIASEIARITGARLYLPNEEEELPGAPDVVTMDTTRYKNEFGKKDFVSMEDGIRRTVEWQRGLYGSL